MLPALATVADLEARLGLDPDTLTGADKARAEAALNDASALVRYEARVDWVAEDGLTTTAPDVVVRVVLGAALRDYRNPEGDISQTVGPFSRTIKASEVGVYLTDAEREIVRRYRPTDTGGLWTLRTERDHPYEDTYWMEDSFGFELFPIGFVDQPWR
jgi:hypothetical protein